jgi:hypothetical protein
MNTFKNQEAVLDHTFGINIIWCGRKVKGNKKMVKRIVITHKTILKRKERSRIMARHI